MNDILKDYFNLLAEHGMAREALRSSETEIRLFLHRHAVPKRPKERLYMESKYDASCWVCKKDIMLGTPIYWSPDRPLSDRCRHPFCAPTPSPQFVAVPPPSSEDLDALLGPPPEQSHVPSFLRKAKERMEAERGGSHPATVRDIYESLPDDPKD